MGRDKALLELDGMPLWRRQRDVLWNAGAAEVFLSARGEQPWVARVDRFSGVVFDPLPECGPIMGIAAGLERMSGSHLAVLAIDLPRIGPEWYAALQASCAPGIGAVGRRGGYFEPLAAIYPAQLRTSVSEQTARQDYSLQRLLAGAVAQGLLRVIELTPEQAASFENWNEPV